MDVFVQAGASLAGNESLEAASTLSELSFIAFLAQSDLYFATAYPAPPSIINISIFDFMIFLLKGIDFRSMLSESMPFLQSTKIFSSFYKTMQRFQSIRISSRISKYEQ
jgi:hypothetical protein